MTTKTVRYHLQLSEHRTTISLDKIISDLMAIKLETAPRTKEAHMAVRKQLESFIAHDLGRSGRGLGEYLTEKSVLFISDKMLSSKYDEWWFEALPDEIRADLKHLEEVKKACELGD